MRGSHEFFEFWHLPLLSNGKPFERWLVEFGYFCTQCECQVLNLKSDSENVLGVFQLLGYF